MNYIKQVNYYWQQHEVFSLSGNECGLYMYILKRSNSSSWRNPIEVMSSVAIECLHLKSFREIQSSRDRLQRAGLINYKTNGSKVVSYSIFDVELQTFAPTAKVLSEVLSKVSSKVSTEVDAKVDENTSVLYKPKLKPKYKAHENNLEEEIILKPDEILIRLRDEEHEVREYLCNTYSFTPMQYDKLATLFVGEKTSGNNRLQIPYPEVLSYFKNWARTNSEKLKSQLIAEAPYKYANKL